MRIFSSATHSITTHPDRVVYPDVGIRKQQVIEYYTTIAEWLLPDIKGRPLALLRCPAGIGSTCFFQKHPTPALGTEVFPIRLLQKRGIANHLFIRDAAGLLALVQANTLEFHPWNCYVTDLEHPDRLVFDLDPGEGVTWSVVVRAARDVRNTLQRLGLESAVRLSGGNGVHVVVPLTAGTTGWLQASAFSRSVAQAMSTRIPDVFVSHAGKAQRQGRIFIDWLRNHRGATSVANWSLRARPGAPVAVPLRWSELGDTSSAHAYDLATALARIRCLRRHPWDEIFGLDQRLPKNITDIDLSQIGRRAKN